MDLIYTQSSNTVRPSVESETCVCTDFENNTWLPTNILQSIPKFRITSTQIGVMISVELRNGTAQLIDKRKRVYFYCGTQDW